MSKKKKKRTAGDVIRTLILILALGVFLFSADFSGIQTGDG